MFLHKAAEHCLQLGLDLFSFHQAVDCCLQVDLDLFSVKSPALKSKSYLQEKKKVNGSQIQQGWKVEDDDHFVCTGILS